MRRFIVASCLFAFACAVVPAQAGGAGYTKRKHRDFPTRHVVIGKRVMPIVVYDYQPGVTVRAYWRAPWRSRHYFPKTGTPPGIGRHEDLLAPRRTHETAETFEREWSTTRVFIEEEPGIDVPADEAFRLLHNRRLNAPPPGLPQQQLPPPAKVKP